MSLVSSPNERWKFSLMSFAGLGVIFSVLITSLPTLTRMYSSVVFFVSILAFSTSILFHYKLRTWAFLTAYGWVNSIIGIFISIMNLIEFPDGVFLSSESIGQFVAISGVIIFLSILISIGIVLSIESNNEEGRNNE